jgi:hypothetical protein
MEGWRQERLGSRAGTHREEEKNKNILTGKEKKKNILDTHRPSHGRGFCGAICIVLCVCLPSRSVICDPL